jgi:hypothetical protein
VARIIQCKSVYKSEIGSQEKRKNFYVGFPFLLASLRAGATTSDLDKGRSKPRWIIVSPRIRGG